MNFFEGIIQIGAAAVDTVTAVVTYPVDILDHGLKKATLETVGEVGTEIGNVAEVVISSPLSAAAVAVIAN